MTPEAILHYLLTTPPLPLNQLPTQQGLYALYDHEGIARYVGKTGMGIRRRVDRYHATGDDNSHKFSTVYNAGRMFHSRNDPRSVKEDGDISKKLRSMFVRHSCSAVGLALPGLGGNELSVLEDAVIGIAPAQALSWNGKRSLVAYEPSDDVDRFLVSLSWPKNLQDAVKRQSQRWAEEYAPLSV